MDLVFAAVPLVASTLLGLSAAWLGRRLPQGAAVKVLAITAFTTALATGFCLSVVAFDALARIPAVAAVGRWSAGALGLDGAPPPVGGVLLGLTALGLFAAALHRSLRTAADLAAATLTSRQLHDLSDGLVLIQDPTPDAFALPGLRGKIDDHHRHAHRAHPCRTPRPDRPRTGPPARPPPALHPSRQPRRHRQPAAAARADQVRRLAERWADEQAASHVNDRCLTARALAKAALARHASGHQPPANPRLALAGTHGAIAWRALALTQLRPKPRPRLAAAVLGLAVSSLAASLYLAHSTEAQFEHAQRVYLPPTARTQHSERVVRSVAGLRPSPDGVAGQPPLGQRPAPRLPPPRAGAASQATRPGSGPPSLYLAFPPRPSVGAV